MIREFETLTSYLTSLQDDADLAVISITDYAREFGIGRAAVERQLARGTLHGMRVERSLYVQASSALTKITDRESQIEQAEAVIVKAAKRRENIAYSEVMSHLGLNYRMSNDRSRMGVILGLLSCRYYEAHGVLLSSIVVKKGTDCPADGYYNFIKSLEIEVDDEDTFHLKAQKRVWKFFQRER